MWYLLMKRILIRANSKLIITAYLWEPKRIVRTEWTVTDKKKKIKILVWPNIYNTQRVTSVEKTYDTV